MDNNVKYRSDFNTDIRSILNADQLAKLKKELGLNEQPEDRAMPELKDQMRKKVMAQLKQQNVSGDRVQDILKQSAMEDFNEKSEVV